LTTSDEEFPQIDDVLHSKFNVPQAYAGFFAEIEKKYL